MISVLFISGAKLQKKNEKHKQSVIKFDKNNKNIQIYNQNDGIWGYPPGSVDVGDGNGGCW